MKVVSINCESNTLGCAREFEAAGQYKKAAVIYEKLVKVATNPLLLLSRLMILYRKLKLYDKEISVINKSIAIHQQHYKPLKGANTKANRISKALNIALGMANDKGKLFYKPDEVLKLEKRKIIAQKKRDQS